LTVEECYPLANPSLVRAENLSLANLSGWASAEVANASPGFAVGPFERRDALFRCQSQIIVRHGRQPSTIM
jgi:hypothetical protein